MTKIIEFQEEKEPLVVSEFRTEFHFMNVFFFLIYLVLAVVGFYCYLNSDDPSVISYEFGLGIVGTIQMVRFIMGLLRDSLAVWTIYEDEVYIKSIYINKEINFKSSQIVNYVSNHVRAQFETGQSDGYKHFSFLVKFDENAEPEEFSIDQFTFTNFFEMRQAILDMADYRGEED